MSTPVFKKPIPYDYLDTTDTLAGNSDVKVPSQKAVKTYVDTQVATQMPDSLIDAKGDIVVGSADNTPARLAVGANGKVLTADSGEATGMKWAEYGTNSLVINETPSGTVNGSNTAFDTANAYVAGSIQVYRDGQLLKGGGADYTETDSNTITFVTAPSTGSVLLVSYQVSSAGTANADTLDGQHAPTGTIVGNTDTQTLSNKTLTAPVINGAITGDALATGTTITTGTANDDIVTSKALADATVGKIGAAWTTWTPDFSGLGITIGNGTATGAYFRLGRFVAFKLVVTLGSTSSVGVSVSIPLPVAGTYDAKSVNGQGVIYDNGGGIYHAIIYGVQLCILQTGGTYSTLAGISSTVPITFATGDVITINGFYETTS